MTAIVRIGLAVVLLSEALLFWPYAVELYSTAGPALPYFVQEEPLSSLRAAPDAARSTRHPISRTNKTAHKVVTRVHPPVPPPVVAILLATAHIFSLCAVAFGWRTRSSLAAALVLTASLAMLGGIAVLAKYTILALHFLLLLICTRCGQVWSVDALAAEQWPRPGDGDGTQPVWPRRLMQLTVCHMYLGAALTKLHIPAFFTGELLEFSLLDDDWGGGRFGLWLATQQSLVMLASLVTFLIELLFPFLVWVQRCRLPLLALAYGLHGMMGLAMNVGVFTPFMFVALAVFLTDDDLAAVGAFLRRRARPFDRCGLRPSSEPTSSDATVGIPSRSYMWRLALSWPGYAAALVVVLGLGFGVHWYRDDYGVFGRRAVPPLTRFSKVEVEPWLAELKPQWSHYLHEVRVGSRVNGQQVFGSATRFHRGDRLWLVVRFNSPHPPLRLEGLLLSPVPESTRVPENNGAGEGPAELEQQAQRVEVGRFSQKVEGAYSYAARAFELMPDLQPGRYTVIVQIEGYEVWQRSIELVP